MNKSSELETHDARQSAYRGEGKDAQEDGRGRNDPSAEPMSSGAAGDQSSGADDRETDGAQDVSKENRTGKTQPNFGQSGSYGQSGDIAEHTKNRDD